MQHHTCHLTTEHVFGTRHIDWFSLSESDWDLLSLPSHLQDQIFRASICPVEQESLHLFEFIVSDQFPKESFSHLVRSAKRLCGHRFFINILHNGSLGTHIVVCGPDRRYHLDLDFNRLTSFDRTFLALIQVPDSHRYEGVLSLLAKEGLSKGLFNKLRDVLKRFPKNNLVQHRAMVDLLLKLIFLVFVQKKGWLNLDPFYLERKMNGCHKRGLSILSCFLKPLFARLNGTAIAEPLPLGNLPHLGGGLFSYVPENLPILKNELFLSLHRDVLAAYSFTLFEEKDDVYPLGVTPEVLGTVFESLMEQGDRKSYGVFFTPSKVARRQVSASFEKYFQTRKPTLALLRKIRVLDPSCGSGTYLVAAFQHLLKLRLQIVPEQERYNGKLFELKSEIVLNNLFGMDINPLSVRLTEVRLWLNMIQDLEIGSPDQAPQLPHLQHHIRTGDFLATPEQWTGHITRKWPKYKYLKRLKSKFIQSRNKQSILNHMLRLERELNLFIQGKELHDSLIHQLEIRKQSCLPGFEELNKTEKSSKQRVSPHEYEPLGPHIAFCGEVLSGGFDFIIGNPPWLSSKDIPAPRKEEIVEMVRIMTGFRVSGQMDLCLFFTLLALSLLKKGGQLGFLLPGKFLQANYGKNFRMYLKRYYNLVYLFDYGIDHGYLFQADTFPLALGVTTKKSPSLDEQNVHKNDVAIERIGKDLFEQFSVNNNFFGNNGSPWMIPSEKTLPLITQSLSWPKLEDEPIKINRGIVTGNKKLFTYADKPDFAHSDLFRPLIRGRDLQSNMALPGAWILWPFEKYGCLKEVIGERAFQWFRINHVSQLKERIKYRPRERKAYRVIWRYLDSRLRAWLFVGINWIPDQTTYYIDFDHEVDALRYFYLFNSEHADTITKAIAERGKDRYQFYYAHTIGQIPIPQDLMIRTPSLKWNEHVLLPKRARDILWR